MTETPYCVGWITFWELAMAEKIVDQFNGLSSPLARTLCEISDQLGTVADENCATIPSHKRSILATLQGEMAIAAFMLATAEEKIADIDGRRLDNILTEIVLMLGALEIRSIDNHVREAKSAVTQVVCSVREKGYTNQRGTWLPGEDHQETISEGIELKVGLESPP